MVSESEDLCISLRPPLLDFALFPTYATAPTTVVFNLSLKTTLYSRYGGKELWYLWSFSSSKNNQLLQKNHNGSTE